MDSPTNLYNLPIEILIKIFGYLNYYDILTISLVCKRFLGIFEYPKTLKNIILKISNVETILECPIQPLFKNSIRNIPNISIINSDINLFHIYLLKQSKYLQLISFNTVKLENEQFFDIIQNATNLTELIIKNCKFIDYNIPENIENYKLTTLLNIVNFTYLDGSPESSLIFIKILNLINPIKLENFKLSIKRSDEQQTHNSNCCCEFLQPLINRKIKSFEIHKIQLNCCKRKIFHIINNNDNILNNLKITQSYIFNDSDIVRITNTLKNLKIFGLKSCHNLTNVSALSLENLHKLEQLTISECSGILHGINGGGLKYGIGKSINANLTDLILFFIDINSDCMIQLSENLPNLKKLMYIHPITTGRITCKITDYALQSIIKNLKSLKHLELMGCTWLTNYGVTGYNIETGKQEGLSINQLKNLENLNLFGCEKISDYFILNNFQLFKLKCLRLSQITIESMTILIDKCKYIEKLDIKCDFDTDEILYLAITYFRMLKEIRLSRFCSEGKKLMCADVQKYDSHFGSTYMNCYCSTCTRLLTLLENFQKRSPLC